MIGPAVLAEKEEKKRMDSQVKEVDRMMRRELHSILRVETGYAAKEKSNAELL